MNELTLYSLVYLANVVIMSFAQILLKKSAGIRYANHLREYLNGYVVTAYLMAFAATLLSVTALRVVPLSTAGILAAAEYLFVAVLSVLFFRERLNRRKLLGLAMIVGGAVVYSL